MNERKVQSTLNSNLSYLSPTSGCGSQEAKCDLRRRLEPEIIAWQDLSVSPVCRVLEF